MPQIPKIEFFKLASLPKGQKQRKVLRLLERAEHSCLKNRRDELLEPFYLSQIFKLILDDLEPEKRAKIKIWIENPKKEQTRTLINLAKHNLYELTGANPAEWDLILPKLENPDPQKRFFFPELYIYAEDIRAPFNLGSIFRTAEAFGVEKIFLSPDCVSPKNSRAERSAMGCIDYIPWEHCELTALPPKLPLLALETGGEDIAKIEFPQKGILLIGSEELGLSPEALKRAEKIITIPMQGIKASINVAVAFGICLQKWTEQLR